MRRSPSGTALFCIGRITLLCLCLLQEIDVQSHTSNDGNDG